MQIFLSWQREFIISIRSMTPGYKPSKQHLIKPLLNNVGSNVTVPILWEAAIYIYIYIYVKPGSKNQILCGTEEFGVKFNFSTIGYLLL